jgi:glyoxylase-like metal-dependent hydrolase (beta-lactamase superfamily II)
MTHDVLATGPLQCNCQILGDEDSKTALVVDPGDDIPEIEQLLQRRGLAVAKILFTHAHFDHIGRAAQLKRSSGAPTWLHRMEIPVLESLNQQAAWIGVEPGEKVAIDHYYDDGDVVEFAGHELQVLFTPGHSPGSVSFYIPSLERLIAGDVLFRDSIGRTDLPGGNTKQLLASIRDKVLVLPDDTAVFPGHGPSTTIGRERRQNPFLKGLSEPLRFELGGAT